MKFIGYFFLLSAFLPFQSGGQTVSETKQGDLLLNIRNINFVKNNEYFSPVTEGYTLLGYFFQPALVYFPSEKVTLKAGVHLLSYSGTNRFSKVKPVFSTTYNFSERTSLTIGTLNGSDKHQMFDPHFDLERTYSNYSEDGFQFLTGNDHLFNDTWVSWENFIFKGDTTREIFTFGESFRYKTNKIADFISFEFPVQLQAKHRGGQISNYNEKVETFINLAAGPRINFDLAKGRYGTIAAEYLRFVNRRVPAQQQRLNNGYADWYRLHYTFRSFYLMAGYWESHNFYAPNGNSIYSSVSDFDDDYIIPDRRIMTYSVYLRTSPAENTELFLGLDVYYDLIRKRADTALALHLSFDKLIHLITVN